MYASVFRANVWSSAPIVRRASSMRASISSATSISPTASFSSSRQSAPSWSSSTSPSRTWSMTSGPDRVEQRDAGRDDPDRPAVRVAARDRRARVHDRGDAGRDQRVGRDAIDVAVVDDRDVAGVDTPDEILGAAIGARGPGAPRPAASPGRRRSLIGAPHRVPSPRLARARLAGSGQQLLRVTARVRRLADTGEHARDLADARVVEHELGARDRAPRRPRTSRPRPARRRTRRPAGGASRTTLGADLPTSPAHVRRRCRPLLRSPRRPRRTRG